MSNEFDFDTKNGWTHYADAASQEQMDVLAARYMDFLSHAKTERETVDLVVEALKAAGFSEDFKKDLVFRTYRGKAVFVAQGQEAARFGRAPHQRPHRRPAP